MIEYNDVKNIDNDNILKIFIASEVVELIQIYSDKELSDNEKNKYFNECVNRLNDGFLESQFWIIEDITNSIVLDLRDTIVERLNIKQVDDLKDSYINN